MHAKKGLNDALSVEKEPHRNTDNAEACNATAV